jgi:hypothetical protein
MGGIGLLIESVRRLMTRRATWQKVKAASAGHGVIGRSRNARRTCNRHHLGETTMAIQLLPVQSSNLKAVGYDHDTQTLAVQFPNGNIYHYDSVPQSVYDNLMADESKGLFFSKFIRQKYNSHIWTPAMEEEKKEQAA